MWMSRAQPVYRAIQSSPDSPPLTLPRSQFMLAEVARDSQFEGDSKNNRLQSPQPTQSISETLIADQLFGMALVDHHGDHQPFREDKRCTIPASSRSSEQQPPPSPPSGSNTSTYKVCRCPLHPLLHCRTSVSSPFPLFSRRARTGDDVHLGWLCVRTRRSAQGN